MYSTIEPCIFYGVMEWHEERIIEYDILDEEEMEIITDTVWHRYADNIYYGIVIETGDKKEIPREDKEKVDNFCKKYSLSNPQYGIGIIGDFIIARDEYKPKSI